MSATLFESLRSRAVLLLAAGSLAVATGCGDDDQGDGGGGDRAEGTAPPAATTDTAAPLPDAKVPRAKGSGPALSGDVAEARQGATAVDDTYESLRAAAEAGIAATNVPALATLDAADDNAGLTKVCDLMSEEAQRQTIVYVSRSAGLGGIDWTCEKATGLLLRRARAAGGLRRTLRSELVGVAVDGDRATATVRFGRGAATTIPLVKEDGQWKLAAAPQGGE